MKKVYIPFFLLWLVIACSATVSGPSKEMISEVMQAVKSVCGKPMFGVGKLGDCRDYELKETKKLELTKADKANGISEKWEFTVYYLQQNAGKWEDKDKTVCGRIVGGKLEVGVLFAHPPAVTCN